MTYTNDMRHAVRAIKNPTPLPIDVAQQGDKIRLLVSRSGFAQLNPKQQSDFRAYTKQVVSVLELGGTGRVEVLPVE